jgi:hypothetical protein
VESLFSSSSVRGTYCKGVCRATSLVNFCCKISRRVFIVVMGIIYAYVIHDGMGIVSCLYSITGMEDVRRVIQTLHWTRWGLVLRKHSWA